MNKKIKIATLLSALLFAAPLAANQYNGGTGDGWDYEQKTCNRDDFLPPFVGGTGDGASYAAYADDITDAGPYPLYVQVGGTGDGASYAAYADDITDAGPYPLYVQVGGTGDGASYAAYADNITDEGPYPLYVQAGGTGDGASAGASDYDYALELYASLQLLVLSIGSIKCEGSVAAAGEAGLNELPYFWNEKTANSGAGESCFNLWVTSNPVTDSGLSANTSYWYEFKARSRLDPSVNFSSTTVSTYTYAAVPTAAATPLTSVAVNSVTANWNGGGNPSYTKYLVQYAAVSPAGSWYDEPSGWQTGNSHSVGGLNSNSYYQFRVKARNELLVETTNYLSLGEKYTLIQTPEIESADWTVESDSIRIDLSAQTFTNIAEYPSGMQFYEEKTGEYRDWSANTFWNKTGLATNTTYSFKVRAKNQDNVTTNWQGPEVKATKIESVGNVSYIVGSSSIGVKATASGGSFSNLDSGASGIYYAVCVDTYHFTNNSFSSRTWTRDSGYHWFTKLGDDTPLSANVTYYFITNSRNYDGLCNSTTTVETKWTLAVRPAQPTPGLKYDVDFSSAIGIRIEDETPVNPSGVEYAIAVSSYSNFQILHFVQNDGSLGDSEEWSGKSNWNGLLWDGAGVLPLEWNTTYYAKVKARNLAQEETAYSEVAEKCAFARPPYNLDLSTGAGAFGRLDGYWQSSDENAKYRVQISSKGEIGGNFDYVAGDSGWMSQSSWTFTGLNTNCKYYMRALAQNRAGVNPSTATAGNWITEDEYAYTLAEAPENLSITGLWLSSATVSWQGAGNPADTKYLVEGSSNGGSSWFENAKGWGTGGDEYAGWIATFTALNTNTEHQFRVKARNGASVETGYSTSGSSCTWITTPGYVEYSAITAVGAVVTAKKTGSPFYEDMDEDISSGGGDGVKYRRRLSNQTWNESASWYDSWGNSYSDVFAALSANTTYWAQVKARNKENIETPWLDSANTFCTRIQAPEMFTDVDIDTRTIKLKVAGTFNNLGALDTSTSAVSIVGAVATGDPPAWNGFGDPGEYTESPPSTTLGSNAGWWKNINEYRIYYNLTQNASYYFRSYSRNRTGDAEYLTAYATYYTFAAAPGAVEFSNNITTGSIQLKTSGNSFSANNNPSHTEYAIKITTGSIPAGTWAQSDGTLANTTYWAIQSNWNGKVIQGLTPNTSYQFSVCAKNQNDVLTVYSSEVTKWTKIESAYSVESLEISTGAIKVNVAAEQSSAFTNLGEGQTHIRVSTATSGWPDSIYHSITSTTVYTFGDLLPNTSYTIKAKAYNGEGTASGGTDGVSETVAARIELSTAVVFGAVTDVSIQAKTGSIFTNLNQPGSGWSVYGNGEDSGWKTDYTYHTFSGLSADTTYYFKTRSRNRAGLVNDWSGLFKKCTLAKAVSVSPALTVAGTNVINISFTDPGNTSSTKYRIAVSSTNWATTKYVQSGGTLGNTTYWANRADWGGGSGKDVTGLAANTLYKFKVAAANSQGEVTGDSPVSEKYTKIESPTGISYINIWQSSVTVKGAGTLSNLSDGGIQFSYSADGTNWNDETFGVTNEFTKTGLTANTTYSFKARTKSGTPDGIINSWVVGPSSATRIEKATGVTTENVSSSSIDAKPANVASLTNLGEGDSGWQVKTEDKVTSEVSYSTWITNVNYISSSTLSPNRQYGFSVRSRNYFAYEPYGWGGEVTTYTLCNVPGTPLLEALSNSSLKVTIEDADRNGNPAGGSEVDTLYSIQMLKTTDGDWDSSKRYVTDSGTLTFTANAAAWKTRSNWGGDSGAAVTGLEINTDYRVRLVAKNNDGVETAPGTQTGAVKTLGNVYDVSAVPKPGAETTAITLTWEGSGVNYDVVYGTSAEGGWTTLESGVTEKTTTHYEITPSSRVYYSVRAFNGTAYSDWSAAVTTVTWAAVPGAGSLSEPTTNSLKLDWGENGNPSTVDYYAEVSVDSTTWSSVAGNSGWVSVSSATVTGLLANTKYYHRVKARNSVGRISGWKVNGTGTGIYTKIEDANGFVWLGIGTSSITVEGGTPITNLGSQYGSSGIDFKNLTAGTSTQWIQTNQWANTGLSANTTYEYTIRTRNGNEIANGWITAVTTATRIETVESAEFIVESSSIGVSAKQSFANLTAGDSGIKYWETTTSTNSLWRQTTDYWYLSGLEAAKTYTFKAMSRNRLGLENGWSAEFSTATLANVPASSDPTDISSNSFTANWGANGNVSASYEIWWSTAGGYSVYSSSSGLESPSYIISDLTPNTTYYSKVRAFNPDGVAAGWCDLPEVLTKMETPGGLSFAVDTDSITVTATGDYTNIVLGESGINIWNKTLSPNTSSHWQKTLSWDSTALETSREHTFRIYARNQAGEETGFVELATATLANKPGVNELTNFTTYSIKAQWTANDNWSGTNYYAELSTQSYGGLILDSYGWGPLLYQTFGALEANKKHYFRVKAKNPSGIETEYTNLASSYTKIENPAGLSFEAGTSSIAVEALGTLSNLGDGISGIVFDKALDDSFLTGFSSSGWIVQTSTAFGLAVGGQLQPNVTYWFRAKTRNGDGNFVNDFITEQAKVTLCETPPRPSVGGITGTSFDMGINEGGNSSGTEYALRAVSGGETYYVSETGILGDLETWATKTNWGNPVTVSNLSGNTQYVFSIKARNHEGIETDYSASLTSSTLASQPYQPNLTSSNFSTWTITVIVDPGTNSEETEFAVAASSDEWASEVYVSSSTGLLGATTGWATLADWSGGLGVTVKGLEANKNYAFKTRARNNDDIRTVWSPAGSKYTKIETPTGQAFSVNRTSITVTAEGNFSNAEGYEWLQFKKDSTYSAWQMTNGGYDWTALTANTVYNFYTRTRNTDLSATNILVGPEAKATRIEPIAESVWQIAASSIGVKTTDTLTNLANGESGIWWGCYSNSGYTNLVASTWTKSADYWYVTTLTTNTVYYFKANSRNYDGLLNSSATFGGKSTLALVPGTATVSNLSAPAGETKLKVVTDYGDNPDTTLMAIAVSTDSGFTSAATRYVYYDTGELIYKLQVSEDWREKSDWRGGTGFSLEELSPNVTYYFKVKAKNNDNVETVFSAVSERATRTTAPSAVSAVGVSSSTIGISWSGNGAEYAVQWSTAEAGTYYDLLSGWITDVSTQHFVNSPNASRWYKVKARNHAELETDYAAAVQGYTNAIMPAADEPWVTDIFLSSAVIHWTANGNQAGTEYQAVVSTNVDFSPALSTAAFTADMVLSTFTALSSNTSYYFRVRAKGAAGSASNWTLLGSTWTQIEEIGVLGDWEIRESSIGVKAAASFNNLDKGQSGIWYGCYSDAGYSALVSSSSWLKEQDFWQAPALDVNTTYYFKAASRNGAGIATAALEISTATAIEEVESLEFTVGGSSIAVAAKQSFANLTAGDSGIEYYVVTKSTASLWRQTTAYWWFDDWGTGLTPGGAYTFKARSRNNKKNTNEWSAEWTTYTLCNVPAVSEIELVSNYESSRIKVALNKNGNDNIVNYAIAASSDAWGTTSYVSETGILGDLETWGTYSEWGGAAGTTTINLAANEEWAFKIKAKNGSGVETDFSTALATATYIEAPSGINFEQTGSSFVFVSPAGTFDNLGEGTGYVSIKKLGGSYDWKTSASAFEIGSLTPNTTHTFYARAKNRYGNLTGEIEAAHLTKAAVAGYNSITQLSTDSAKARWTANGNDLNTEYFVTASTAADYSVHNSSSGWQSFGGVYEYTLAGLSPNVKYYFGVKARNFAYEETEWRVLDSSYTKIQEIGILGDWEIGTSSIGYTAKTESGSSCSNLGEGESGIRYYCYSDSGYSEWLSSTPWVVQTSTRFMNLTANTTYYFRTLSRNGDGIETAAYQEARATAIEEIGILGDWEIGATSIGVSAKSGVGGGEFTNLTTGVSGIYYTEITTGAVSLWRQTTGWWTLSGLNPNKQYTFKGKSRNRAGLENDYSAEYSTYTLANVPAKPTLSGDTTYSVNVIVNENSNPSSTEFAIAVSSYSNFSITKYAQETGILGDLETWQTKINWGGAAQGTDIRGLEANRRYYVKVKARNSAGRETILSSYESKYTLIENAENASWDGVWESSITLSAVPSPSNLTTGGILFRNNEKGTNSSWVTNNTWNSSALTANTLYNFYIQTKSGEPVINDETGPFYKATRIETPTGVEFDTTTLTYNSISAKATGSFTNLSAGESAVTVYCSDISSGVWSGETGFREFTGLSPNVTYYFTANSRNYEGVLNSSSAVYAIHTLCVEPSSPTVLARSKTSIQLKVNKQGTAPQNPDPDTEYVIAVSTASFAAGTTYYMTSNNGPLSEDVSWGSRIFWGSDVGGTATELSKGKAYSFKVKARNKDGLETGWGEVTDAWTLSDAPYLTVEAVSTTTINLSWTQTGLEYDVEFSTTSPSYLWQELYGAGWTVMSSTQHAALTPNVERWYRIKTRTEGEDESSWDYVDNSYAVKSAVTHTETPVAAAYSAVTADSITGNWTQGSNPAGTKYYAELSPDNFNTITENSGAADEILSFNPTGALSPNMAYNFRVRSHNNDSFVSTWTYLGSTYTLCGTPSAPSVTVESPSSVSISTSINGNPAATTKYAFKAVLADGTTKYVAGVLPYALTDAATYYLLADWDGITVTGLNVNASYWWSAAAMNGDGVVTAFGAQTKKYTKANVPAVTGAWEIYLSSVTVNWGENGNPDGTLYRAECDDDPGFGSKDDSGDITYSSYTFSLLSENTLQYFKVKAKDGNGDYGDYVTLGSSATMIESVASNGYSVMSSSIGVNAVAGGSGFSNLAEGQSGIYYELRSSTDGLLASSWTKSADYYWFEELSKNTSYYFVTNSRNYDGSANSATVAEKKSTLIELPTGVNFVSVTTYTVTLKPLDEFTNLTSTKSGVEIKRYATSDSSGWLGDITGWVCDDKGAGLEPAKEYTFQMRSRNQDEAASGWIVVGSTATHPNPPGQYSWSISDRGVDYIKVDWGENGNSNEANYWIEASRQGYGGVVISSSGWLASTTYYFLALEPNASYYIQAKAKNSRNVASAYTQFGSSWTKIEAVSSVSFDGIFESSVTFSAIPDGAGFSNAGDGLSGVTLGVYNDEVYSSLKSSTAYSADTSFTPSGLSPNVTYYFTANSRNGVGEGNTAWGGTDNVIGRVTRIERPTGVEFSTVTNTSLKVRPEGVDGFSNLAAGFSGAISSCTTPPAHSGWKQTADYWNLSGLTPNTTYWFKANSRNSAGLLNVETALVSTMTKASKPQSLPFTDVTLNTISANWNSGSPANPDGTEYQCQASTVSSTEQFNWDSAWQTIVYYDFDGMEPNTKYYFRVRSRNALGTPSDWVNMGTKYTLIESASDISIKEASTTSITVKTEGTLSNLGSGLSGVFFEEQTTSSNSDWLTNTEWAKTGLSVNTSYFFRVRSRNGDATDNPATEWIARATEIEEVTGIGFSIYVSSAEVKPSNAGSLSNLGQGSSGWNTEAYSDAGLTVLVSSSNWQKGTDFVTLGNFTPNATYYFVAQSRNVAGSTTTKTASEMKHTICEEPSAPFAAVPPPPALDTDKLRVTIVNDGNPGYTEYLIAVSSYSNFQILHFVQNDGGIGESEVWRSSESWHGFNGYAELSGLSAGTTYWMKVKARNLADTPVETVFSAVSERATRSAVPVITLCEPKTGSETNQLTLSWTAVGEQYLVQFSTDKLNPPYWDDLSGWITETSTSPAGLSVNKQYWFQVKAKNAGGLESNYSTDASTWTWSEAPQTAEPTSIFVSSMTANWGQGNNPTYTDYKAQCSTTTNFNGSADKESGWVDASSYDFENLAANTKYFFRARSRTDDVVSPVMSSWTLLNPTGKYTLIENPTSYWQMVGISSITVKAAKNGAGESLTNLGAEGVAKTQFKKLPLAFGDGDNLETKTFLGLTANTTYGFEIKAVNGNSVWTAVQGPFVKATKIELPTGLDFFDVRETTVAVKCVAGNFTDLVVGDSAFRIRKVGAGWSDWFTGEDSSHTVTELTPSSQVSFEIISRNRENISNAAVTFSTYTKAEAPEIYSVEGKWSSGKNYHTEITIDEKNNLKGADGVKFAVYNTDASKYINPADWDLLPTGFVAWSTSTVWYHETTNSADLLPNTGYSYKVKAKNQSGITTAFSEVKTGTTPAAAPENMRFTDIYEVSPEEFTMDADCNMLVGANAYNFYINVATGGWSDSYSEMPAVFSELSPNIRYSVYARASSDLGVTYGAPSASTQAYSAIESVKSNEWQVFSSSLIINGLSLKGGFGNLESGASGLRFYCYEDEAYNVWKSSSGWIKFSSSTFTELEPNTSYFFKLRSRNGDGLVAVNPDTFDDYYSTMTWTRAAVPEAPTLSEASNDSIKVTISSATNPAWTEYSICNITENKYVGLDGSLMSGATYYRWDELNGAGWVLNDGLKQNTGYQYKVRAKSGAGILTGWSDDSAQLNTVGVNAPGWAEYSSVGENALTPGWTANGNPGGTLYLAQISTDSMFGVVMSSSEWHTDFGFQFTALSANTRYYSRVQAADAGIESVSGWTNLGGKYTLLERPDGIVWEATDEDYITVKVTGTLSNLSDGFSGILFEEIITGENPGDYIKKKFWTLSNLTANTTYGFRITGRNGDGASGSAEGPFIRATLMEGATGMTFTELSSTTLRAEAAGLFTNVSEGSSAIKLYETQLSTDSGWIGTDGDLYLTDLRPNTSYYFYAVSRNREATAGPVSGATLKYTYAAEPSTPTAAAGSSPSEGNYIDVTPVSASNPQGTYYLIDIAEDSGFTAIVSSGQLTAGVLRISNLEPNTAYYVRSRAKNAEGCVTDNGPTAQVVTCPASPADFRSVAQTYYSIRWRWEAVEGAASYNLYSSVEDFNFLDTPEWEQTGLDANTSYWAYATAVGATGEGGASDIVTAYTLIETPEGAGFGTISSTSIKVNSAGSFTAMGEGLSAVRVGRFSYTGSLIDGATSPWQQPAEYYEFASLSPNKEYSFDAQARNIVGSTTPWGGMAVSTYTLAETPLAATLSNPTTYSLKVTIARGNNPISTEYAIYCNEAGKFAQADGSLGDAEFWQEYSEGIKVTGLVKDNSYTFRLKARNFVGIETGWGPYSESGITTPSTVVISSVDRQENVWVNVSTVGFTVTGSDHYHYRFTQLALDSAQTTDEVWDGSTRTLTMTSQGDWYLHVRGENGAHGFLGSDSFGPLKFDNSAPEIASISCYYEVTMATEIFSGEWTSESTPYFVWQAPESTSPVKGYSILWTSSTEQSPDESIDKNLPNYSVTLSSSGLYYLKVKAKDEAGNWGAENVFTYKYAEAGVAPEVEEVELGGVEYEGGSVGVSADIAPAVSFNRDIDSSTIENKVVMRAVRNNYGEKGLWEVTGSVSYDAETNALVFTPAAELLKNYTYEMIISAGIKDLLGNEISAATVKTFRTVMDPGVYNAFVGSDEKTKVKVEAGAVGVESFVTVSTQSAGKATAIAAANGKLADAHQYPLAGGGRDFNIYDSSAVRITADFNAPVEVEIPYLDDDNDGIVDGSSPQVKVETLAVYYLNETTNSWEKVSGSRVNDDRKVVIAPVSHFSYYTIMGRAVTGVGDSYAYPVPWRPGDNSEKITFGTDENSLPQPSCVITVYTISGQKVRKIEATTLTHPWDVKTEGGAPVASGVYIYVIEGAGGAKTGKLIIIR